MPLKPVLDAELHDTRIAGRRCYTTKGAGVEIRHRVAPVEVVEQIEDFHPELELAGCREGDEPRKRDIGGPESRSFDAVVAVVAVGARGRGRKRPPLQV